tara:strand:+ start:187 stop:513 length:327 start_codon:yes stop_codon:yes gene_type:complete
VLILIGIIIGLILIVYLIVSIFQLIELSDNILTGKNQNDKSKFVKTLVKISIIFSIGIYIEVERGYFPSTLSNLAFLVWGSIIIITPCILLDKFNKKIKKIIKRIKKK